MTSRTVALIVPSEAYRIDDFVEAANRLGVDMVVATEGHHALAEDMGAHIIPIDFSRPDDAAKRIAASSLPLDAVVSIDDRGVVVAAKASAMLGHTHNTASAAEASRDKGLARSLLLGIVRQPQHQVFQDPQEIELEPPWVLKPVGLAGSIGVMRIDDRDLASEAVEQIRRIQSQHGYPHDHPLLAETFVSGPEIAIEALLAGGVWSTLAVFDKPDEMHGPSFPETHYVTPTRHDPDVIDSALTAASNAASHLGITDGPVHVEFRLSDDGPVLIELAARPIGGLCGRALRFGLAENALEELIIRNAVGDEIRSTRLAPGASGVSMIPVPRAGTFRGIGGIDEALEVADITDIEVARVIGQPVKPLPEASTYLGFVFARAETPERVEAALRQAGDRLEILID